MQRHLRSAWLRTLAYSFLWLCLAALVGALAGQVWMALAIVAILTLGWHHWRLRGLILRSLSRRRLPPATGSSSWDALENLIAHNQRQTRARKRRLLEMLQAYRAAADALPDAVVVVDRNTQRIEWFNQAAGPLLGLQGMADRGKALVQRLQPMPLAHWLTAGRHAEPILDATSPHDPNLRLHLRLVPYSDHRWLLVARDVTKLLHLERVRRDFVANVSHELRTPLTVVHGYLDMMEPEDFPGTGPMLEEMRKQSQRMTQLVEDLLTLSRLEAQSPGELDNVSMAPVLATLQREANALSQGRHRVTLEDDGTVDLLGSVRELHSAFSNLVSNAVRYTPEGGSIAIRLAREGQGATLSVRDTGYGIASQHIPRLTERFYRVSSSRSRESGGTGLGLSIVKHILGLHNAHLVIHSEVGKGSEFSCRFDASHVTVRNDTDSVPKEPVTP